VSWDKRFFDPITLPGRKRADQAARCGRIHLPSCPHGEHDAEEWQAAMQALLLVAEHDGPTMFARIGVMKALNRGHVREFNPSRKKPRWGRRKLARDQ